MTDTTTIIDDIDQHIAHFEAFIAGAHRHPLPEYNFDQDYNLHPWFRRLRETEAEIWMFLAEQIRPALSEAKTAGTGEQTLLRRYHTLLGLVSRFEALIEQCRRKAPWMTATPSNTEQR